LQEYKLLSNLLHEELLQKNVTFTLVFNLFFA
jgi:hypothetical protein